MSGLQSGLIQTRLLLGIGKECTLIAVVMLEIAIRKNGRLLALCYGVPSKRKMILKLHDLERSPTDNPITNKVLSIALFAA